MSLLQNSGGARGPRVPMTTSMSKGLGCGRMARPSGRNPWDREGPRCKFRDPESSTPSRDASGSRVVTGHYSLDCPPPATKTTGYIRPNISRERSTECISILGPAPTSAIDVQLKTSEITIRISHTRIEALSSPLFAKGQAIKLRGLNDRPAHGIVRIAGGKLVAFTCVI